MTRPRRRGLAIVAVVVAATVSAAAALAQPDETPLPDIRLHLTHLTTVLGPGLLAPDAGEDARAPEQLDLRLLVENRSGRPVENLEVEIEVFDAVENRSALQLALDGGDPRRAGARVLEAQSLEVRDGAPLAPGDLAGLRYTQPAGDVGIRGGRGGVAFPLRVSVEQGTETLDTVTTAVVYLDVAPTAQLVTAIGWPFDDTPWRRAGGRYPDGVDTPITAGGRLDRLLDAAETHPNAPLTFTPAAHLLEDLADRAGGFTLEDGTDVPEDAPAARRSAAFLDRLRSRLLDAALDPITAAYADADLAGLVQAPPPLDDEAASAVSRGRQRLTTQLGRAPDPVTYWSTTPLDRAALDVLVDQTAVERLLLPFEQTGFAGDLSRYPEVPGPLLTLTASSGRRVQALVPDPYLQRVLVEPDERHGPVVAAQRVVAETAVLWSEAPSRPRALLVLPPRDWDPFPRYAQLLLDGLVSAPWLGLDGPEAVGDVTADRGESGALPRVVPPTVGPGLFGELARTRRELAAVQQATPTTEVVVGGRPVDGLETQLLRAPSIWLTPARRQALVDDTQAAIDRAFGAVQVAEGARITLTSETGQIPITLQRPTGSPIDVLVELRETRANLQWPRGRSQPVTLPGGGATTISFAVRARSTGSFTVDVEVWDPAHVRLLDAGEITIRSAAISGPALLGTGIVVLVLIAIGLLRRRPRRPQLQVVGTPGGSGSSDDNGPPSA